VGGPSRTAVKSLAQRSWPRDSTKIDMRGDGLGPREGGLDDVQGQLRIRPRAPSRGRLDVPEYEHPPRPSIDPRGDPRERRRTRVQSVPAEGGDLRARRGDPGGPGPRRRRHDLDERRERGGIHREPSDYEDLDRGGL